MEPKDRLIVALDLPTLDEAILMAKRLLPYCSTFKIGLELIMAAGAQNAVQAIHFIGGKVFLDTKLNDIPNTLASATKQISQMSAAMYTIHASSGIEGMSASAKNRGESLMIAVTVLTSIGNRECLATFGRTLEHKISDFIYDAKSAHANGFVCSAYDLLYIDKKLRQGLICITPGVRPRWAAQDDQQRLATPTDAIRFGADCLVVGRPIINPPPEIGSSEKAASLILEEITAALSLKSP